MTPEKKGINLGSIPAVVKEDIRTEVNVQRIRRFYRDRLRSIALSQFEYENLPDTMDRWYLELTLLDRGSVAIYEPLGMEGMWFHHPWIHQPPAGTRPFDTYGYPTGIVAIDFNGVNIQTNPGRNVGYYILYDNQVRGTLGWMIDIYAELLAETHQTVRQNLRHQNTPYIIRTEKKNKLSVLNFFQRVKDFEPVIAVDGSLGSNTPPIEALQTQVPFIGNDLMLLRDVLWHDALHMLGVTSETTKKERLLTNELSMNRMENTITLNSRLLSRMEFCNWFNERTGANISVNLAQTASEAMNKLMMEDLLIQGMNQQANGAES